MLSKRKTPVSTNVRLVKIIKPLNKQPNFNIKTNRECRNDVTNSPPPHGKLSIKLKKSFLSKHISQKLANVGLVKNIKTLIAQSNFDKKRAI